VFAETTKFLRTWIIAQAVVLFSVLLQLVCSVIFVRFYLLSKAAWNQHSV